MGETTRVDVFRKLIFFSEQATSAVECCGIYSPGEEQGNMLRHSIFCSSVGSVIERLGGGGSWKWDRKFAHRGVLYTIHGLFSLPNTIAPLKQWGGAQPFAPCKSCAKHSTKRYPLTHHVEYERDKGNYW